jgi:hypothetical protein
MTPEFTIENTIHFFGVFEYVVYATAIISKTTISGD